MSLPADRPAVDRKALRDALLAAANKRLTETFKEPSGEGQRKYPALATLVAYLEPSIWQRDPPAALIAALRRAIPELPDETPSLSRFTWREIGWIMFGFRTVSVKAAEEYRVGYRRYFQAVRESLFPGNDVNRLKRQIIRPLWDRVANILLELEPVALPSPRTIDDSETVAMSFVDRKALRERFRSAVESGARLIILVGQPGMGKTSFARVVTQDADTAWIRVEEGSIHGPDLTVALLGRKESPPTMLSSGVERLAWLLTHEGAPAFVVLDNLESTDELRGLLPHHTRSTVVATCRHVGASLQSEFKTIEVGPMERTEAVELVNRLAPAVESDDAGLLASTLAQYPLAISYACGLLPYHEAAVEQLAMSIAREAGSIPLASGDLLRVILCRVIATLEERDPAAMALLIALTRPSKGTPPLSKPALLRRYLKAAVPSYSASTYPRAITALRSFSLVTFLYADRIPSVHAAATTVIRELTVHRLGEFAGALVIALAGFDRPPTYDALGDFDHYGRLQTNLLYLVATYEMMVRRGADIPRDGYLQTLVDWLVVPSGDATRVMFKLSGHPDSEARYHTAWRELRGLRQAPADPLDV